MIGPIFVLLVVAAALLFYRRRIKKHNTRGEGREKESDKSEKAQLHGESVALKRHELEGDKHPDQVYELLAMEPVALELEGNQEATT